MKSCKFLESRTQPRIPKSLFHQFSCKPVMSVFELGKTTTYSSYAYQLWYIYSISRLRGNVTWHMGEVYDVEIETVPFIVYCSRIFTTMYMHMLHCNLVHDSVIVCMVSVWMWYSSSWDVYHTDWMDGCGHLVCTSIVHGALKTGLAKTRPAELLATAMCYDCTFSCTSTTLSVITQDGSLHMYSTNATTLCNK